MTPLPDKVKMNDTPYSELGKLTKEFRSHQKFKTYLMFIPSRNPEDENCVWVPLKVVDWDWAVAVKRVKYFLENPPCDKTTFNPLFEVYPKPKVENCSKHPEWTCNVEKNPKKKINASSAHKLLRKQDMPP